MAEGFLNHYNDPNEGQKMLESKVRHEMDDKKKSIVRQEVMNDLPYFYNEYGVPNELINDTTDKYLIVDIARLGKVFTGSHNVSIREWNRKDYQSIGLSAWLPGPFKNGRPDDFLYRKEIPLDIAEHLIENEKINVSLGWYDSDRESYDNDTGEILGDQISPDNFVKPKLKANINKDYTKPWQY